MNEKDPTLVGPMLLKKSVKHLSAIILMQLWSTLHPTQSSIILQVQMLTAPGLSDMRR